MSHPRGTDDVRRPASGKGSKLTTDEPGGSAWVCNPARALPKRQVRYVPSLSSSAILAPEALASECSEIC